MNDGEWTRDVPDAIGVLSGFCIGNPAVAAGAGTLWAEFLEPKSRAMVMVGALIAVSAPEVSIQGGIDEAIGVGATADEIIAILDGLAPVVGMPCAMSAALRIAAALDACEDLRGD